MKHEVHVFEVEGDAKPSDQPEPVGIFAVVAATHNEARSMMYARLTAQGRTVRSLSFQAGGGLAAVLTQPAAASASAEVCHSRGGR